MTLGCYHLRMIQRKRATATALNASSLDGQGRKTMLASGGISHDFDLETALPYLLARAGTRMGQAFSKELRRFDLSLTEWRVCAALHHMPHQRLSQLAAHTSTEPSTLSRLVDGMLQRGLLVRDRSDEDARALALSLTEAGMELTLRIVPLAQLFERVALGGISSAQAEALRSMLRTVYDNLEVLDKSE